MDFGDIQVRYHSHNIVNGLSALPVPQNPMLEKRILTLSPIGKKLAGPYQLLGSHLGFWLYSGKIPLAKHCKWSWCIASTPKPYVRKKNFDFISHRKKVSWTISHAWRPSWILADNFFSPELPLGQLLTVHSGHLGEQLSAITQWGGMILRLNWSQLN